MQFVRRIRLWAVPFALAIGAFSLPFGTVTACDAHVRVTGFQLVAAKPPSAEPSDAIASRGGGLAVAAFACALIGLAVALRRGRRVAVLAVGAAAGGALALWELVVRGRNEADAFIAGNGLWLGLGAFGAAGLVALAAAFWRWSPRRLTLGDALGCAGVAALGAGSILPFLAIRGTDMTGGFSLVDFVSPGAGRVAVWLGIEAVVLVLAAAFAVFERRGGFLIGAGAVSLAGHTAMIVELLHTQNEDDDYSFTLGSGLLLAGSLLLILAGLALARPEARRPAPLSVLVRIGFAAGAGLAIAAAFVVFDEGGMDGDRQSALHLHDFPLPLAYGAAPFLAAGVALLAAAFGRRYAGILTGVGFEALLIFLGPVYTLFAAEDGRPGTGVYVGLAAGGLLLASALAAVARPRFAPVVTKPSPPVIR